MRIPSVAALASIVLGATLLAVSAGGGSPAVRGPAPAPEERRPPAGLRVACLNVWAIPFVSHGLAERMERLPAALREFDPDVICLQEMWDPLWRRYVRRALAPEYAAAKAERGGLAILSRLPILEESFTPYAGRAKLSLTERLAGKGILEVRLATPQGEVRVVTSHLALAFGEQNPRTEQLGFLLDHLEARRDLPLVLAADLNTPPTWRGRLFEDYERVLERGFVSADPPRQGPDGLWRPGKPTREGWPREVDPPHLYWPDHVLVRDGNGASIRIESFRVELDRPGTALSDHNLLLADVRVSPTR